MGGSTFTLSEKRDTWRKEELKETFKRGKREFSLRRGRDCECWLRCLQKGKVKGKCENLAKSWDGSTFGLNIQAGFNAKIFFEANASQPTVDEFAEYPQYRLTILLGVGVSMMI